MWPVSVKDDTIRSVIDTSLAASKLESYGIFPCWCLMLLLRRTGPQKVWQADRLKAVYRCLAACCSGMIHSFVSLACSFCSAHAIPAGRTALGHVHLHQEAAGLLPAEALIPSVDVVHLHHTTLSQQTIKHTQVRWRRLPRCSFS